MGTIEEAVDSPPAPSRPRRGWVAAVLGIFVPGLGQLYGGEGDRALIAFAAVWSLNFLSFYWIIRHPSAAALAISGVATLAWIVSVVDGYRTARRSPDPFVMQTSHRWMLYVALIALHARWAGPTRVGAVLFGKLQAYRTPSVAMAPTIEVGDRILAGALPDGPLTRGYIGIFTPPTLKLPVIKRVIGLPGDTLRMTDGVLFLNGRSLVEPYVADLGACPNAPDPHRRTWGPIIVPAGSYFMLGDNRDCSVDSRDWGVVSRERILSRPLLVGYSAIGDEIRWDRIGMRIK